MYDSPIPTSALVTARRKNRSSCTTAVARSCEDGSPNEYVLSGQTSASNPPSILWREFRNSFFARRCRKSLMARVLLHSESLARLSAEGLEGHKHATRQSWALRA